MKMKAVITGPMVQGVGYRVFLMHQAIIEGIERFSALNVSDNALVVLAEADEEKISNLKELLLTRRPEHAQVSEVRIEDFKGLVMTLEEGIFLNKMDMMDKILSLLRRMDKTLEKMVG